MTSIAITGGIGSGKSQVFSFLKKRGYPVLDADLIARQAVLLPDVQASLVLHFGTEAYLEDGAYHREHVRNVVFADPQKRLLLESILHPKIGHLFLEKKLSLDSISPQAWLFYEAALIFETGRQKDFDAVVLVTAPLEERFQRLQKMRGLERSVAEGIVNSQWDDSKKRVLADYCVANDGSLANLDMSTTALVDWLRERFFPSTGI